MTETRTEVRDGREYVVTILPDDPPPGRRRRPGYGGLGKNRWMASARGRAWLNAATEKAEREERAEAGDGE